MHLPDYARSLRWYSIGALVLILAVGAALIIGRAREMDARLRTELIRQASLVCWALDAAEVAALSGSEDDLSSQIYQRIKTQLSATRALYPDIRFIYLARALPDGRIIFLADSEDPTSGDYSPPGQVYEEVSEEFRALFRGGPPITEGPIRDRWGLWVSALVPIYPPSGREVIAVLGMDVDARTWRLRIYSATIAPIAFTAAMLVLWGLSSIRLLRERPEKTPPPALFRPEALLAMGVGLVLTVFAVYVVYDAEHQRHRDAFMRKAELQASLMQEFLGRVGKSYLQSIAHFFESSDQVTEHEYRHFVSYLVNRPYALYWGWIPIVPESERATFRGGPAIEPSVEPEIWERDLEGRPTRAQSRAIYYPTAMLEPAAGREELGFDHGSDPARLDAMRRAIESDSVEATGPVWIGSGDHAEEAILVYLAVKRPGSNQPVGFAVVALRSRQLLARSLSRETSVTEPVTDVALCTPDENGRMTVLATSPGGLSPGATVAAGEQTSALLMAPAFAFGKVYAIVSSVRFPEAWNPVMAMRRTAGVGLLLTGLLTALVATLSSRRATLERLVEERTRELRASESSYHGLFNSIRQAIYIQDEAGRFVDVNDGAVEMYGYAREEFIGRTPEFLSAPGRNDLAQTILHVQRAWAGQPQVFEFWGRRKNGEIFPKVVSLYKGSYFGKQAIIAVASDVTERKAAEEAQARLQAQLQQSQKLESIGRLAGGVAHDFNNMLQAILGNAMLAMEEAPTGRLHEYLSEIKRSAERSADLTRQLLAFASRQPVNPRIIDLNETIAGMLKMLRRLIGEDIHLQWSPGQDVWPVRIDPIQMDQILANLSVNARDAIDGVGAITIETRVLRANDEAERARYPGCPPGDFSILRVRDTGRGMDEHTLEHIFEPFYTTKPDGKGVGLGLATVFGIVKQNEGFIHVDSTVGKGTTFTIGIPRSRQQPANETQPGVVEIPAGGTETILLVEDEESVLEFGANSLRRLGYQVLAETRPERAIERARKHEGPIHLLITDVVMPGMNGRELAQFLSSMRPDIRVLFMSGYTADIIETRGVLDEGVAFIQKPFRSSQFAAKVREVLDTPAPA